MNRQDRYRALFLAEACELLRQGRDALNAQAASSPQADDGVMHRVWHSLKGMAAAMNLSQLAAMVHAAEDRLPAAGQDAATRHTMLTLQGRALDAAEDFLQRLETDRKLPDLSPVLALLTAPVADPAHPGEQPLPAAPVPHPAGLGRRTPTAPILPGSVRIGAAELDNLMGDLIDLESALDPAHNSLTKAGSEDRNDGGHPLQGRLSALQRRIRRLRLLPFATVVPALRHLVATDARAVGCEAQLDVHGGDLAIERGTLELLAETIPHLLRNSLAHGMQDPATRKSLGLNKCGHLTLVVETRRRHIRVVLEDDGSGVNLEKLSRLTGQPVAEGPGADLAPLLCRPGLSTADATSSIAGRGIGLDAVRERLVAAGGCLRIHNRARGGTRVQIDVPSTLTVSRCLVARIGSRHFAFPLPGLHNLEAMPAGDSGDILTSLLGGPVDPADEQVGIQLTLRGAGGTPFQLTVHQVLGRLDTVVRPLPGINRRGAIVGTALWQNQIPLLVLDPARMSHLQKPASISPTDSIGPAMDTNGPTGVYPEAG